MSGSQSVPECEGYSESISRTAHIQQILKDYLEGTQILREFLQNADDARAPDVTFMLDLRRHGVDHIMPPLDAKPQGEYSMAMWQGPALMVFDSAVFEALDFVSLGVPANSKKKFDPSKTGKYGLGFNSAYHITDVVSIISGNKLVVLDPHRQFCCKGDNYGAAIELPKWYDFDISDTLASFSLGFEWCKPRNGLDFTLLPELFNPAVAPPDGLPRYPGTIMRLPFRNHDLFKSKIKNMKFGIDEMKNVFQLFKDEVLELMLFMRYVENVRILIWDSDAVAPVELLSTQILDATDSLRKKRSNINSYFKSTLRHGPDDPAIRDDLCDILTEYVSGDSEGLPPVDADFMVERVERLERSAGMPALTSRIVQRWILTSRFAGRNSAAIDLAIRSVSQTRDDTFYGADMKLVPWAMVACLVQSENASARVENGRLFCTMPIGDIRTKLPFHINAGFELSSDRKTLSAGIANSGGSRRSYEWNIAMLSGVVPSAYLAALSYLLTLGVSFNIYELFPPPASNLASPYDYIVGSCSDRGKLSDQMMSLTFYELIAQQKIFHSTGQISTEDILPMPLYGLSDSYFVDPTISRSDAKVIVQFLRRMGEHVITPLNSHGEPIDSILTELQRCKVPVTVMSPALVLNVLRSERASRELKLQPNPTEVFKLLHYCLQVDSNEMPDMRGVPLVPLFDKKTNCFSVGTFFDADPDVSERFYILNADVERDLMEFSLPQSVVHLDFAEDEVIGDKNALLRGLHKLSKRYNVANLSLSSISSYHKIDFQNVLNSNIGIEVALRFWKLLAVEYTKVVTARTDANALFLSPTGNTPTALRIRSQDTPGGSVRIHVPENVVPCTILLKSFQDWFLLFDREGKPYPLQPAAASSALFSSKPPLPATICGIIKKIGGAILNDDIDSAVDRFPDIEAHYLYPSTSYGVLNALLSSCVELDDSDKDVLLDYICKTLDCVDNSDVKTELVYMIQQLSIFEICGDDKFRNFISLNDGVDYISFPENSELPSALCPPGRCLKPGHGRNRLYEFLGVKIVSVDDILLEYGLDHLHMITELTRNELMVKVVNDVHNKGSEFKEKLRMIKFIPLQSNTDEVSKVLCPLGIISDPNTWIFDPRVHDLNILYKYDTISRFPAAPFNDAHVLHNLCSLGLCKTLSRYAVIERARAIAAIDLNNFYDRAKELSIVLFKYLHGHSDLISPCEDNDDMDLEAFINTLCSICWLAPAIVAPECLVNFPFAGNTIDAITFGSFCTMRPYADACNVGCSVQLLDASYSMYLTNAMKSFIGWDKPPDIFCVVRHLKKLRGIRITPNLYNVLDELLKDRNGCYAQFIEYASKGATEVGHLCNLLEDVGDWIFIGGVGSWVLPIQCASMPSSELSPYLCKLPKELQGNADFLQRLGILDDFSKDSYAKYIHKIATDYCDVEISKQLLEDMHKVIRRLHKLGSEEYNKSWWDSIKKDLWLPILLPDARISLARANDCIFNDCHNLTKAGKIDLSAFPNILEYSMTGDVALDLGVRFLSGMQFADDEEEEEKVHQGQNIDLCDSLRSILMQYSYKTVLKEMCQNADDAGAEVFIAMLDMRRHSSQFLLVNSKEKDDFQGPALVVYNNGAMSSKNIDAIHNVTKSSKSGDYGKTGRFGIGFNSVYHVTDMPMFLTGSYLILFDPNLQHLPAGRYGQKSGRTLVLNRYSVSPDQFNPFLCDRGIPGAEFMPMRPEGEAGSLMHYDGTIFRLPLRTERLAKKSTICNRPFSEMQARELLSDFKDSMKEMSLFLKNIKTIKLLVWEEGALRPDLLVESKTEDNDVVEAQRIPNILNSGNMFEYLASKFLDGEPIDCSWVRSIHVAETVYRYFMTCRIGTDSGNLAFKFAFDNKNSSNRFLPLAGVAALIEIISDNDNSNELYQDALPPVGSVSCFLPMPIESHLPVHINGYFDVSNDRTNIKTEVDNAISGKWNALLRDHVIAPLYEKFLMSIQTLLPDLKKYYNLFPKTVRASCLHPYFQKLSSELYMRLSRNTRNIFKCTSLNGTMEIPFLNVENCSFFDETRPELVEYNYIKEMLLRDGFTMTDAPFFLCEEFSQVAPITKKNPQFCCPQSVKDFYAAKWRDKFPDEIFCALENAPCSSLKDSEQVDKILRYILSDRNAIAKKEDLRALLEGGPFLILASGDIGIFTSKVRRELILPEYIDLVQGYKQYCVRKCDISSLENLDRDVLNVKLLDIASLARIMSLGKVCNGFVPSNVTNSRISAAQVKSERMLEWLKLFYIFCRNQKVEHSAFENHFRRWPVLLTSSGELLSLEADVAQSIIYNPVATDVHRHITLILSQCGCPILNDNLFIDEDLSRFVVILTSRFVSQLTAVGIVRSLLLNCGPCYEKMNTRLSDLQKHALLKFIADSTGNISQEDETFVMDTVKKMPLFKKIDGTYTTLDAEEYEVLPQNIPIRVQGRFLVEDAGLESFYAKFMGVKVLNLAECYRKYLIPLVATSSDSVIKILIDHIKNNWDKLIADDKEFKIVMRQLPFVRISGTLYCAMNCYDPTFPLFTHYYGGLFPSSDYSDMLPFLKKIGMRTNMDSEEIRIGAEMSFREKTLLDIATSIERMSTRIFNHFEIGDKVGYRVKETDIKSGWDSTFLEANILEIFHLPGGIFSYRIQLDIDKIIIAGHEDLADWVNGAMTECVDPLVDICHIGKSFENIKGIFYFLQQLKIAFQQQDLSPDFCKKMSGKCCFPLSRPQSVALHDSPISNVPDICYYRAKPAAYGRAVDICTPATAHTIFSQVQTYLSSAFRRPDIPSELLRIWDGTMPSILEDKLHMIKCPSTNCLLDHISLICSDERGFIDQINAWLLYNIGDSTKMPWYDRYIDGLCELQKRLEILPESSIIQSKLKSTRCIWIAQWSMRGHRSIRLVYPHEAFFDLGSIIKTSNSYDTCNDIAPHVLAPGYIYEIIQPLLRAKDLLTAIGVKSRPSKELLLNLLNCRLKNDCNPNAGSSRCGNRYESKDILSMTLKVLTALSNIMENGEKLPDDTYLPFDPKLSVSDENSMSYITPEPIKFRRANEIVLLDDRPHYRKEGIIDFDKICFLCEPILELCNRRIEGIIPSRPLSAVVQKTPIKEEFELNQPSPEVKNVNELLSCSAFKLTMFRFLLHGLPRKSPLKRMRWDPEHAIAIMSSMLPTAIMNASKIEAMYLFEENPGHLVDITRKVMFSKSDMVYIAPNGVTRDPSRNDFVAVAFNSHGYQISSKSLDAQIESALLQHSKIAARIIAIENDLVVIKIPDSNICASFINPKVSTSKNLVESYMNKTTRELTVSLVRKEINESEALLRVINHSIFENCFLGQQLQFAESETEIVCETIVAVNSRTSDFMMDLLRFKYQDLHTVDDWLDRREIDPVTWISSKEPGEMLPPHEIDQLYHPDANEVLEFRPGEIVAFVDMSIGNKYCFFYGVVKDPLPCESTILLTKRKGLREALVLKSSVWKFIKEQEYIIRIVNERAEKERFTILIIAFIHKVQDSTRLIEIDISSKIVYLEQLLTEYHEILAAGKILNHDFSSLFLSQLQVLTDRLASLETDVLVDADQSIPSGADKNFSGVENNIAHQGNATDYDIHATEPDVSRVWIAEAPKDSIIETTSEIIVADGEGAWDKNAIESILNVAEKNCRESIYNTLIQKGGSALQHITKHECTHLTINEMHIEATTLQFRGIIVFLPHDMIAKPVDISIVRAGHDFALVLNILIRSTFPTVDRRSYKIFYDPKSPDIAFNLRGAIFFNLKYWIVMKHSKRSEACMYFWYHTLCHEIAHNAVGDHGPDHNLILQLLCAKYHSKLFKAQSCLFDTDAMGSSAQNTPLKVIPPLVSNTSRENQEVVQCNVDFNKEESDLNRLHVYQESSKIEYDLKADSLELVFPPAPP